MPQTNYTPILIYASSTTGNTPAAGNLTNSAGGAELAINYFDGRLFYKDASNVVQVLATKGTGTIGGSNTQVQFNSSGALAGSSNMTFNGTTLSVNGLTVTNNPTFNGGTANGVLYLDGSKVVTSGTALTFNGTNLSLTAAGGAYFYTPNVVNGGGIFDAGGNNGMLIFGNVGGSTLRFLASGAEQMRLNSTGLGIGTNNPGQKLHVAGASQYDGTLFGGSAAANTLTLKSTSGNANRSGISVGEVIASDNGGITFNVAGASVETLAMRIQGISGNVGIGTNSPTARLTVVDSTPKNGTIRLGDDPTFYGALQYIFSAGEVRFSQVGGGSLGMTFYTASAERMRLDLAGNLGLGVTPGAWQANFRAIQMFGSGISLMSGLNAMYIMNNTIYDGSFKYVNSAQATSYIQAAGAHQWLTAPSGTAGNAISFTQAMTLDANGNLGVGLTGPGARIHTNAADGTFQFATSGTTRGIRFETNATEARIVGVDQTLTGSFQPISLGGSQVIVRTSGTTEAARFDASGNLGLGVTPSAWNTGYRALDMGSGALMGSPLAGQTDVYLLQNAYFGTPSNWYYRSTGIAPARYQMVAGAHAWLTAPSGTAGNPVSFTQAMTLDSSGRLLLGTTSATGAVMDIQGSAAGAVQLLNIQNTSTNAAAISRLSIGSQGGNWNIDNERTGAPLKFAFGSSLYLTLDSSGNIVTGNAAIATNATNGFLYVPTCAGTPTGTPTTYTGRSPIVVDSTNNKLYFYSGGAWRDAGP